MDLPSKAQRIVQYQDSTCSGQTGDQVSVGLGKEAENKEEWN